MPKRGRQKKNKKIQKDLKEKNDMHKSQKLIS